MVLNERESTEFAVSPEAFRALFDVLFPGLQIGDAIGMRENADGSGAIIWVVNAAAFDMVGMMKK